MPRLTRRTTTSTPAQPAPTQERDASDDEEQPVAPAPSGGKKGSKKITKSVAAANGAQTSTAAKKYNFNAADFKDRPIGENGEGDRLNHFAQDWKQVSDLFGRAGGAYSVLNDVGLAASGMLEGEEDDERVKRCDTLMREIIDLHREAEFHAESMRDVRGMLVQKEEILDLNEQWEKGIKAKNGKYLANTARSKYGKDEAYIKFREAIWETRSKDAMPPINTFIAKEDGDDSDDDDIEVGGVTQDFKCPITLMELNDPMSSTVCKHSYDKKAIQEYLETGSKKCPGIGCSKQISLATLREDPGLAKRAKAHKQRVQRAQEQQEEEDVDEVEDDD